MTFQMFIFISHGLSNLICSYLFALFFKNIILYNCSFTTSYYSYQAFLFPSIVAFFNKKNEKESWYIFLLV